MMRLTLTLITMLAAMLWLAGCGNGGGNGGGAETGGTESDGTHTHADGTVHTGAEHGDEPSGGAEHGHHGEHDETPLGTTTIAGMIVTAAQGHGNVEAGKLGHLVIKLPYNDGGESIVRAWIGTKDRDLYLVERGEYAPSHDDYDVHVEAPAPLPDGAAWWIEIEKPDGTKVRGSIDMITKG